MSAAEQYLYEQQGGQWTNHTETECPRCGQKKAWCSTNHEDGITICRTDLEDGDKGRFDKDGSQFWLHRFISQVCKDVHKELFDRWGLSRTHQDHLMKDRGFTQEEIDQMGYKTLGSATEMKTYIATTGHNLGSVPGFFYNEAHGDWRFKTFAGLGIPVRDREGDIIAIKIRNEIGKAKYSYVASAKLRKGQRHGTKAHMDLHWPIAKKPASTIRITEGEFKADFATLRSDVYTVSIPGVSNWRMVPDALAKPENQHIKVIRLAMDSDWVDNKNVLLSMLKLYEELKKQSYKVEIEYWDKRSKGIDDALLAGETIKVMDQNQIDGLLKRREELQRDQDRFIIINDADSTTLAMEIIRRFAKLDREDPTVFRYNNRLCIIEHGQLKLAGKISDLRVWLQKKITCQQMGKEGPTNTSIPRAALEDIMSFGENDMMDIPKLEVVTNVPVLSKHGKLHTKRGFDPETGIYLTADYEINDISDAPTEFEIEEAKLKLLDLVCDFPFVHESDVAHYVALILQPFLRPFIDGQTPLYVIDKPKQGTGATLLTEIAGLIKNGEPIPTSVLPNDENELRKTLASKLRKSPDYIFFDNVTRCYSDSFASVLTTNTFEQRELGTNEELVFKVYCTFILNGNNISFGKDYPRRICNIRLDANMSNPETRKEFKYKDIKAHVKANRNSIIRAILTLIQAWRNADMPLDENSTKASYEEWSRKTGGLLNIAGIEGFGQTPEGRATITDTDEDELMELMAHWLCLVKQSQGKANAEQMNSLTSHQLYELMKQNNSSLYSHLSRDKPMQAMNAKLRKSLDQVRNFVISGGKNIVVKLVQCSANSYDRKYSLEFINCSVDDIECELILPGKVIQYDQI